jgi:hypothetical protein
LTRKLSSADPVMTAARSPSAGRKDTISVMIGSFLIWNDLMRPFVSLNVPILAREGVFLMGSTLDKASGLANEAIGKIKQGLTQKIPATLASGPCRGSPPSEARQLKAALRLTNASPCALSEQPC